MAMAGHEGPNLTLHVRPDRRTKDMLRRLNYGRLLWFRF
jgi:hypothetical protein